MPVIKELRQFICETCPGKYDHHPYRLWYERVWSNDPYSECSSCREEVEAVPRGEEEGVHICHFKCADCKNIFVVRCRMCDTAPCYECGEEVVEPHSFEPLRKINSCSDNVHKCSRCPRSGGTCPNLVR